MDYNKYIVFLMSNLQDPLLAEKATILFVEYLFPIPVHSAGARTGS
jgi:hypothetical protein